MKKSTIIALAVIGAFLGVLVFDGLEYKFIAEDKKNVSISWKQDGDGWSANTKTLPNCPNPTLKAPVNLDQVTSILYPGQMRGGDYKPHGGFRFDDKKDNKIEVIAPIDARVVEGARYLENGSIQYMFSFISDCGIMYRFDHLLALEARLQDVANSFPEPKEGDSRTTTVSSSVRVLAGETLASEIGVSEGGRNVFVDFGVYNLREENKISGVDTWVSDPKHNFFTAKHAVCWFNLLSSTDSAKIKSLPAADSISGYKSDYCN